MVRRLATVAKTVPLIWAATTPRLVGGAAVIIGLVVGDTGWASSIWPREVALKRLDEILAKAYKDLNNPQTIDWVLRDALAKVKDNPRVYKFYVDVLSKSQNPGCVWLALRQLPNDPGSIGAEERHAARMRLLEQLSSHQSLWIRLQVARHLREHGRKSLACTIALSLAREPKLDVTVRRELHDVIVVTGNWAPSATDVSGYFITFQEQLIEELLQCPSQAARTELRRLTKECRVEKIWADRLHAPEPFPGTHEATRLKLERLREILKKPSQPRTEK